VLGGTPGLAAALEESERLWVVGQHAFDDGLYSLARRVFDRLIERYPADPRVPEANLLVGKARFAQKAYQPAVDAFRRARTAIVVPGRPGEAAFWEGEALFRLDRFAEAREAYDRVLTETPSSPFAPDALYGRGWTNRELKNPEQAAEDLRRFVTDYPDNPSAASATYYLALSLMDLKRAAEAVPLLRPFATKYPGHKLVPAARYALGEALIDSGEGKDGLAELREFVASYPNHELTPQARKLIVDGVIQGGSKEDLTDEYKRLTNQSATTPEALYDAAAVATRLGRTEDAEASWARLRKEFPGHPLAMRAALDLAQTRLAKMPRDAIGLAQVATKSDDEATRSEAFLIRGEAELKLKRHAAAFQSFQSALAGSGLEPALRFRAMAGSGLAQEEQQKWADAARFYDEVAAKSPDKTLRAWAKERRAAVGPKLKPSEGKAAPKSSAVK
jgi:TolA-binding protein